MTKKTYTESDEQTNGVADTDSSFIGSGAEFTVTFHVKDIVEIAIPELSAADGAKAQNGTQNSQS